MSGYWKQELTPRQEMFIQEYIQTGDPMGSYKRAGYKAKDDEVARICSYQLLQNPKVRRRINDIKSAALTHAGVTEQQVISQYARIAFADITDYVEIKNDGSIKLKQGLDGTVISEISTTQTSNGVNTRVKIERSNALQMLAKHLGLISDNVNVTSSGAGTGGNTNVLILQQIVEQHPELVDTIFNAIGQQPVEVSSGEGESNRV